MIEYEDFCVGCPKEMGCLGSACPNKNVPVLTCDICGKETDELYEFDAEHYCMDCLQDQLGFTRVEI